MKANYAFSVVVSGSPNTTCLFNESLTVIIRLRSLFSGENELGMCDFFFSSVELSRFNDKRVL